MDVDYSKAPNKSYNFPDVTHLTLEASINQESIENLNAFSKLSNQAKANQNWRKFGGL